MLNMFFTSDADDKVIMTYHNKKYTLKDMKMYIAGRINEIKNKPQSVIIASDNAFAFFINFFSAIFANKNIFLLTDKNKMLKSQDDVILLNNEFTKKIPNYVFPKIDIDKPIVNCFTSGTSDKSKCVKKSICNLITEADDIVNEFDFKNKSYNVVSSTTMCHLYGLTFYLMVPLASSFVICADKIIYPELNTKNCIFVSTPSFLNYFEKHNIGFNVSPDYIISAGSKLPQKTFEYLEQKSNVIEIYGSTEAGATAYKLSSKEDYFTPFKNVKISQNNHNNLVVSTNYSHLKKVVVPDMVDIVYNKIFLKNRADRIVKVYEKRIDLEEQEQFLKKSKYISDVCCLKHGEKLAAVVVLSEIGKKYLLSNGSVILQKMLKKYCNENFEVIPQRWRFLSEIPKTSAGKIDRGIIDYLFDVNFSFPIILDKNSGSDKVNFELFFPGNSSFYDGHFPEFPITPGVVLLYIAHMLSNYVFKSCDISCNMRRIKFSKILEPDTLVNLFLNKTDKNVEFIYSIKDKVFSSGNFPYEQKKE